MVGDLPGWAVGRLQAFFSPDPEDADLIRAVLSATVRYGDVTLDVPSLHCWLRARLGGYWQPPTLAKFEPLPRIADFQRVQALIREVIAAHSGEYAPSEGWQEGVVAAMEGLMPPSVWGWLDPVLTPFVGKTISIKEGDQENGKPAKPVDPWR